MKHRDGISIVNEHRIDKQMTQDRLHLIYLFTLNLSNEWRHRRSSQCEFRLHGDHVCDSLNIEVCLNGDETPWTKSVLERLKSDYDSLLKG